MCERVGVYVRRRKKRVESHVRMRLAPIDEKKKKRFVGKAEPKNIMTFDTSSSRVWHNMKDSR